MPAVTTDCEKRSAVLLAVCPAACDVCPSSKLSVTLGPLASAVSPCGADAASVAFRRETSASRRAALGRSPLRARERTSFSRSAVLTSYLLRPLLPPTEQVLCERPLGPGESVNKSCSRERQAVQQPRLAAALRADTARTHRAAFRKASRKSFARRGLPVC